MKKSKNEAFVAAQVLIVTIFLLSLYISFSSMLNAFKINKNNYNKTNGYNEFFENFVIRKYLLNSEKVLTAVDVNSIIKLESDGSVYIKVEEFKECSFISLYIREKEIRNIKVKKREE